MEVEQCKFTEDGYCLRPENDYCSSDECKGDYSIKEVCKHPNKIIRVLKSSINCETTFIVCADCFETLTEPKTECR